ncbi:hypothetical protein FKW77_007902 [Venturia effusa]|uniref:Uncharacterized protein n=1 Tax=Venturia effusa TaxID=50376 RepID=A0A517LJ79_9PEZI|nr:hypothetical protein FKW77_007902 [Venturia effusa]
MSVSEPSPTALDHVLSGLTKVETTSSSKRTGSTSLVDETTPNTNALSTQPSMILHPWSPSATRKLMDNESNFQETSGLDVLTVTKEKMVWTDTADDTFIQNILAETKPGSASPYSLIIFFVSLEHNEDASYWRQANISQSTLKALMTQLDINDAAILDIFGRPDYWSSFARSKDIAGEVDAGFEFFCQHPRWLQKGRHDNSKHRAPCSIYLHHDRNQQTSYYVVSAAKDDSFYSEIRLRMGHGEAAAVSATNPFFIHALVSGLAFEQSKEYLDDVRKRLMDPIAEVNDYSEKSFYTDFKKQSGMEARQQLKDITKQLHLVSQTCDSGIANAAMSLRLCEDMLEAYDRFVGPLNGSLASWRQTRDSMAWLSKTWLSQKNWLVSYKARKDTAMNFVFNLVTQQDNSTNIDIAVQSARYSSSMNIIIVLTMIFLPGTFLAGVFGSGILSNTETHGVSDVFWPFLAIFVPLTILTMVPWFWRQSLERGLHRCGKFLKKGRSMSMPWRTKAQRRDVELGNVERHDYGASPLPLLDTLHETSQKAAGIMIEARQQCPRTVHLRD